MLVQCDVKGLEVVAAAFLSQDKVLYKELNDGVDIHGENQKLFGFQERVVAKIFKFKLLYGAMEYGFANDPDMNFISKDPKYWSKIIEKYYSKYTGIAAWHEKIIREVSKTSRLEMFTGRTYEWDLMKYGTFKVPTTQVKNYPVQGLGADVVAMARVSLHRRWKNANIRGCLVNTVHDSIVADVVEEDVAKVVVLFSSVFSDLPTNLSRIFGVQWDLNTSVEVLVGHNMLEMEETK